MRRFYFSIFSIFILHSCGPTKRSNASNGSELNKIEKIIKKYKGQGCNKSNDYVGCKYENITSFCGKPSNGSLKQRILIIDDLSIPRSAFLKNKGKLLHFLRIKNNRYISIFPTIRVPTLLHDLMKALALQKRPLSVDHIYPYGHLLYELHRKTKIVDMNEEGTGHGVKIFNWLCEFNPHAQFIMAEVPSAEVHEYCNLDKSGMLPRIRERYRVLFEGLKKYIVEYKINYINLSYVSTNGEEIKKWRLLCRGRPEIDSSFIENFLKIKYQFVKSLASLKNVLVFQAIPNRSDKELFYSDNLEEYACSQEMENIVRVGHVNIFKSDISSQGIEAKRIYFPKYQKNVFGCGNIFVNSGIDELKANNFLNIGNFNLIFPKEDKEKWWDNNSLQYYLFGVIKVPIESMSNSWAVPLVLSVFNHLFIKNSFDQSIYQSIKYYLNGLIIDPLKNNQFEQLPIKGSLL